MKKKYRNPAHPFYNKHSLEIFPGTLRERSLVRLGEVEASEGTIQRDMHKSGILVEEFPEDRFKLDDFTRPKGRKVYLFLRGYLIKTGKLGIPVPYKELHQAVKKEGYFNKIDLTTALRDAWKMGLARRFVRGFFYRGDLEGGGGKKHGVHYIIRSKHDTASRKR